ncbi:MAG: hypothetical protein KGO52_11865 [Nitrospirota bacterium]|nr:hypothetical protein [Nitrospirota bacterium]
MHGATCLRGLFATAVIVGSLSVGGCAEPPQPVPQKDIRSHADQFNEKMKQEEQGHGQSPQDSSHGMMH